MDDTPRTDAGATPSEPVRKRARTGMMWAILAVVLAFVIGFGWQFYEAYTVREQLSEAEQELVLERLRVRLGQAALAAQRGEYEAARQQMSSFYNDVGDQPPAAFPSGVAGEIQNFTAMRDDIITGLSRSNPEYADVLYGMLEDFEAAVDEAIGTGAETGTGGAPSGAATGAGSGAGPGNGTDAGAGSAADSP